MYGYVITSLFSRCHISLKFKLQQCNLSEINGQVKERCMDMQKQNMMAKVNQKVYYRCIETEFGWSKISCIRCCTEILCLKVGSWKLRIIKKKRDKLECPLCLGEEDVKRMVFRCS
jgi:hypothetical protein